MASCGLLCQVLLQVRAALLRLLSHTCSLCVQLFPHNIGTI